MVFLISTMTYAQALRTMTYAQEMTYFLSYAQALRTMTYAQMGSHVELEHNPFIKWVSYVDQNMT